jgi:hypothetical protein
LTLDGIKEGDSREARDGGSKGVKRITASAGFGKTALMSARAAQYTGPRACITLDARNRTSAPGLFGDV